MRDNVIIIVTIYTGRWESSLGSTTYRVCRFGPSVRVKLVELDGKISRHLVNYRGNYPGINERKLVNLCARYGGTRSAEQSARGQNSSSGSDQTKNSLMGNNISVAARAKYSSKHLTELKVSWNNREQSAVEPKLPAGIFFYSHNRIFTLGSHITKFSYTVELFAVQGELLSKVDTFPTVLHYERHRKKNQKKNYNTKQWFIH